MLHATSYPAARRPLILSLIVVLLAGCAVGPDYRTPQIAVPAQWSSADQQGQTAPNLSEWWKRLNDSTLDALIDEAVQGNLDVATAKAKIREARASRREAIGGAAPSVSASASATRGKNNSGSSSSSSDASGASGNARTTFEAGFDASWELDLFGANRRNIEAATRGVEAAEEDLRATLVTLLGDVTAYYVEARGYQARAELARNTAVSQQETADLTRARFEAGSASAIDLAKAEAQASSTQADVHTYEVAYREAVHRLGVLLGREPTALLEQLAASDTIPQPVLDLPKGVPADILSNRPDVRSAERQLAQATAKIGQAEAARYPSVSLTGSISTSATKSGDLAKSSSIGWSIGPNISIPIFNGGELEAAVEVTQAQRDQYYIAFRSAILTALEDVENATISLDQERLKYQRLDRAAQGYREAARLARLLYQSGSTSFLDVLDAERSQYSADDSLLQSRIAITTDYIALAKALGGGWDGEIESSKPEIIDADMGPRLASPP